jgi:hypothetical protein
MAEGFLVVLRNAETHNPRNPRYRGLYRTPPFEQKRFDEGFDDPYLVDPALTTEGLLPTQNDAERVRDGFARTYPREELDVIHARVVDQRNVSDDAPGAHRLGFDVAGLAPFWSILADISVDPDADNVLAKFLSELNENGLFSDSATAHSYRDYYVSIAPETAGLDLYVWDVRTPSAS